MKKPKQIIFLYGDGSYKGYNWNAFLEWLRQNIVMIKKEQKEK